MKIKRFVNKFFVSVLTIMGISTGFGMTKSTKAVVAPVFTDTKRNELLLTAKDIEQNEDVFVIVGENEPANVSEVNEDNINTETPEEEVEVNTETTEEVIPETPAEEEITVEEPLVEVIEEDNIPMVMSIAPPSNPSDPLVYTSPTTNNILGDATNWNGFILGDVTDCIDFEGSIAVAGDINSNRGLSVNSGAYGGSPVNTEDISLLVGGNLNLNCYGNVWGQTATGTTNGNTYNLSNVTSSGTTNNNYMVVDSTQYFIDAATALKQANQDVANKSSNASYTNDGYGSINFENNASEKELVYTVPESSFSGFNLNFNLNDGQTAVVNLTSSQAIEFLNGSFSINGNSNNTYLRENAGRITINIVNSNELNMTSCELYGTLLAPNTNLIGDNASVCGIAVVNNLEAKNGFEFHVSMNIQVPIQTPPVTTPPTTTPPTTTPPTTTPPTTTPPVTKTPSQIKPTPTPVPTSTPTEKPEIPEEAPKTGDESVTDLMMYAGFIGLAFATGLKMDIKKDDELDNNGTLSLKKRK